MNNYNTNIIAAPHTSFAPVASVPGFADQLDTDTFLLDLLAASRLIDQERGGRLSLDMSVPVQRGRCWTCQYWSSLKLTDP